MKAKKTKVALTALLAIGCMPFYLAGCGDDGPYGGPDDEPTAGKSSGGSAGNGGKSSGGNSTKAGSGNQGGDGEGGEGGEEPTAGTGGGKGGAGGTSGAGGKGGAGGTAGTSTGGGGTGGGGTGGGGTGGGMSGAGSGGGGASGTAGSGGSSGGGPGCGNGKVEGDELCDHPSGNNYLEDDCGDVWGTGSGETGAESACLEITPAGCALCEQMTECEELTHPDILGGGAAVEGPATGVKRVALHNEVLDCVRDTNCAANTPLDCYCGTVSSAQCDAGSGNGLCKIPIERGLETTNPTEISNRLSNVTLGGGLALARVACDLNNCVDQCF